MADPLKEYQKALAESSKVKTLEEYRKWYKGFGDRVPKQWYSWMIPKDLERKAVFESPTPEENMYFALWQQLTAPPSPEELIYTDTLQRMLASQVDSGQISNLDATRALAAIENQIATEGFSENTPMFEAVWPEISARQQQLAGEYAAATDPARQKFLREGPLPDYLTAGGSTEGAPKAWWSPTQLQAGQTESTMASRNIYDVARVAARDDWRQQKQELVSSIPDPQGAGWIKSWFAKNLPEPDFGIGKPWYGMTPGERGAELRGGTWGPQTGAMLGAGYTNLEAWNRAQTYDEFGERDVVGGPMGIGAPTAPKHYAPEKPLPPEAPDWLSLLFPQLTAGQPVKPLKSVRTPSAQQWGNLTPTQQAMASGYLGWSRQKYEGAPSIQDLMADIQKRLPKSPYGAGANRWGASRQYA